MDQVTISRELLRQVLDFVEKGNPGHIADRINVLVKLRNALEQPAVEPEQRKAPCARQCEAQAFKIEIRQLTRLVADYMEIIAKQRVAMKEAHKVLGTLDVSITSRTLGARCGLADAMELGISAPQAQQPPRIGSGVTVEETLEQWEHDFKNPMTPEQQVDWVKREREFAARQAQQPARCKHCTKFFGEYRCNASQGECDCPKCQGFCTCSHQPEVNL